jgi:hypothetical protein
MIAVPCACHDSAVNGTCNLPGSGALIKPDGVAPAPLPQSRPEPRSQTGLFLLGMSGADIDGSANISNNKKPLLGRPRTNIGTLIGVRWNKAQLAAIDQWRRGQQDVPTRPDAIRHLVELAVTSATATRQLSKGAKRKAAEMAESEIDRLVPDQLASGEEQAQRKRRLVKGPREFRDIRGDQPKKSG